MIEGLAAAKATPDCYATYCFAGTVPQETRSLPQISRRGPLPKGDACGFPYGCSCRLPMDTQLSTNALGTDPGHLVDQGVDSSEKIDQLIRHASHCQQTPHC